MSERILRPSYLTKSCTKVSGQNETVLNVAKKPQNIGEIANVGAPPSNMYLSLSFALQSSGNEIFYRNPYNTEENLFVSISSPSSSRYAGISLLSNAL